ncbi:MAG: cupin domain-containing protein [Steroidobacteraceae bacterium]
MTVNTPVLAADVPPRAKPTNYPEPFASRMAGRQKRALGDVFGLRNFGVNRTTLKPGAMSALRHWHSVQDEFVYVISGHATLVTDAGAMTLGPGMCVGFRAGDPDGHHLENRSAEEVVYLEIGDRLPGDSGSYPDDDLEAVMGADGKWQFRHKDGSSY